MTIARSDADSRLDLKWAPVGLVVCGLAGLGSLAMIGLGLYAIISPLNAADAYGVPALAETGSSWIRTTGLRDFALGLFGLAFALLRDRRALAVLVLAGAVIPAGDGLIVFMQASQPMPFAAIHWSSAVACFLFFAVLYRGRKGHGL